MNRTKVNRSWTQLQETRQILALDLKDLATNKKIILKRLSLLQKKKTKIRLWTQLLTSLPQMMMMLMTKIW